MVDIMTTETTITGILLVIIWTVAMMECTTEITKIITITMETMFIGMECGENSKILEVSS